MQAYPKKAKTILLLKYFQTETDENTPKSMAQMLEFLSDNGIEAERKSIYADINLLRDLDFDIIKTKHRGEVKYYLSSNLFDLPESEILASAVCAARFITQGRSSGLLGKLSSLLSKSQAHVFSSRAELARTKKTKNDEVYHNVDKIVNACNAQTKISFNYFEYLPDKTQRMKKHGSRYRATPYSLVWFEDALYMVCNIEKYDNLSHFRVDRMTAIDVINEPARSIEEVSEYKNYLDFDDYHKSIFGMFGGERKIVRIRFHESLATAVFDRFGLDVQVSDISGGWFTISVSVRISPGFISWLTIFGSKAKVLSPESLIKEIKTVISSLTTVYEN